MRVVLIFFIFQLLFNCNPVNKINKIQKCSTAISGTMLSGHRWIYKEAGIFKKSSSRSKPIRGSIIKIDDNGIQFDQKDQPQIKFPVKYYSFKDLECVVNEFGEIIYGKIPAKYCLVQSAIFEFISLSDSATYNTINLELIANEPFSSCVEPGEYKLVDMKITAIEDNEFSPIILPNIKFEVYENMNNCLGNILFDLSDVDDSKTRILPYKRKEPFFKLPENVHITYNPYGGISLGYVFFKTDSSKQDKREPFEIDGIHVLSKSEADISKIINLGELPEKDSNLEIIPHESENEIKSYVIEKRLDSYK